MTKHEHDDHGTALDTIATAPTTNADRHARAIASWLAAYDSPHTRDAYRRDALDFCAALDAWGIDLPHTTRDALYTYREALTLAGRSRATVARRLSAVSSLLDALTDAGHMPTNPARGMKRPRTDADTTTTAALTRVQARALLDVARDSSPRDYALIALMLFTAARVSELLGANVSDLSHHEGHRVLLVTRKGGKRARLPIPPEALDALTAYIGRADALGDALTRAEDAAAPRPLFTTATGKRLTRNAATRTITALARRAGIPAHITAHSLRHTYATTALDAGIPLHHVQDALGHADPRTTRRYDHARDALKHNPAYVVAGLI